MGQKSSEARMRALFQLLAAWLLMLKALDAYPLPSAFL